MTVELSDRQPLCLIINFSSSEFEDGKVDDKPVIWKDLLAEGTIARTPGMKGKVPFTVIRSGKSSSRNGNIVVSMSDLMEAFDAKAFQDVTIPDGHPKPDRVLPDGKVIKGDSALNNTGYVRALRTVKKTIKGGPQDGKEVHVLQAGLGFTEPDVAGRVRRGSVPNVSAGVYFDYVRKADDRYFRAALNHAALTKGPWMQNLESFDRAYFSDGEGDEAQEYNLQEIVLEDEKSSDNDAKVIWNDSFAANSVRNQISAFLNPPETDSALGVPERPKAYYYVEDVTHNEPNLARVEESYRGKTANFVVPYTVDDEGKVTVSPQSHWQEGRQAMIAASDDDNLEHFQSRTIEAQRERLKLALDAMFGDDHKLLIGQMSTDGRALILNSATGAEHLARFREVNGHAYFADTADWSPVKLPISKSSKNTTETGKGHVDEVTFDTTTAEGRMAAARHRRAAMLAAPNQ